MRNANSGSATRIPLPAIDAVPPSGITVSARMRPAIGPSTLMCFLSGLAGGRDLPAEQVCGRISLDRCLDRISFGAVPRAQPIFERIKLGAGAPMAVQRLRGRRNLISVEHNRPILMKVIR
jgi:hypothetical protein